MRQTSRTATKAVESVMANVSMSSGMLLPMAARRRGFLQELTGVEDGDGQKRPQGGVTAALQTGAEGHRAGPELQEERGGKGQRVVAHLLPPR